MEVELWKECLSCKNKGCCKLDIAYPLFVTQEEDVKIKKYYPNQNCFNKKFPCPFFNKNYLCDIHNIRPVDCRFFPFDIIKINEKFFWIIWKIDCPIIEYEDFEDCLEQFEEELIPYFKTYLQEYSKFRLEEFLNKYKFEVIREVNY